MRNLAQIHVILRRLNVIFLGRHIAHGLFILRTWLNLIKIKLDYLVRIHSLGQIWLALKKASC